MLLIIRFFWLVLVVMLFFQGGVTVTAVFAADVAMGLHAAVDHDLDSSAGAARTKSSGQGFSLFVTKGADRERLLSQTRLVFVSGLVAAGILYTMPSDVTGWDKDIRATELAERWWDNVSRRPVWDKDDWVINYVGHAYFGGVYYQVARKSGYNQWDSFVYTTLMSTFFWEYGLEAFAERPSIQDLIYTPISGWICGEWAYLAEQRILANNSQVLGSGVLGSISLFFLDPVDQIGDWVNRLSGRDLVITGAVTVGASRPASTHHSAFGLSLAGRF